MNKANKPTQIPLDFGSLLEKSFENFIIGKNAIIIDNIKAFTSSESTKIIFIYGRRSFGKTHLCLAALNKIKSAKEFIDFETAHKLDDLDVDSINHLIIDDLDKILENEQYQDKIFFCINEFILNRRPLLLTSSKTITKMKINKYDLESRLKSDLIFTIDDYSDDDKAKVLENFAIARGWNIDTKVTNYIMNNYQRDLFFLCNIIKNIDEESLSSKKNITIPFVKHVISSRDLIETH